MPKGKFKEVIDCLLKKGASYSDEEVQEFFDNFDPKDARFKLLDMIDDACEDFGFEIRKREDNIMEITDKNGNHSNVFEWFVKWFGDGEP
jgi:hypothetical protein